MKRTLMEQAAELLAVLYDVTGIAPEQIQKEDSTVLSLFQMGTEVNRNTGLDMLPMFDSAFARRTLRAVTPESYEDVRKIRAFLNDGSNWVYTTIDMLEKKQITLGAVLADQTDVEEFAMENGIPVEVMKDMMKERYVMPREIAEQYTDLTWKLAFFKIHCEELYYIYYKKIMADFC